MSDATDYGMKRRWVLSGFERRQRTVIKQYLGGMSTRDIAKEYDVSTSFVRKRLHKWGIVMREGNPSTTAQRRDMVNDAKTPCPLCGETNRDLLVFHHKQQDAKVAMISIMSKRHTSLEHLRLEIAKCVTLCRNCHTLIHLSENREILEAIAQS